MNIYHNHLDAGECIEIMCEDRLIGYVIYFSDGWDGYVREQDHMMKRFTGTSRDAVILDVKRRAMQ